MCGFLSFYHSVYYFRTWYLGLPDFIFPSHGHPYLVHTRTWELCLLGSRRPCSSFHTQQFPTVNHRRVFLGLAVLAHGFRWDPLAGSSHVCCCCSFTLVLSVCHLHVSPPSAQWSDEVPFPSWNLLTWWEGVFQGTFQPPLLPGFHQCVSSRTFLHQFLEHSCFYTFLKPASYLTRVPVAPNLFLQFLHFSRLWSLTLSSP